MLLLVNECLITFKLHIQVDIMRGGTLLILGHRVNDQSQLLHCAYFSFNLNTFNLRMSVPCDEKEVTYFYCEGIKCHKQLWLCETLHVWYNPQFPLFRYKLHIWKLFMVRGGTLLMLDHLVKDKVKLWHCLWDAIGTVQTKMFSQSHTHLKYKLFTMRTGALDFGTWPQYQSNLTLYLQNLVDTTKLQYIPNHSQTLSVSCSWWEDEPFYAPFEKGGAYCFAHVRWSLCRYPLTLCN